MTAARSCIFPLVALLCSGGCSSKSSANESKGATDEAVAVEVHQVGTRSFSKALEIPGDVMPVRTLAVTPKVPGRIDKILVDEGDRVVEGDVLVKLEKADYKLVVKQASAGLKAAKAGYQVSVVQMESLEEKYTRMVNLLDSGSISKSSFDDVEDGYKMTEAQITASQAQVALAKASLASAKNVLANATIRAPFDGLITQRLLDEGTVCQPMPPSVILMLVDDSRMEVLGAITERDLPFVEIGSSVTITIEAIPDKEFHGTIEVVSPSVDPMTRTSRISVVLDNPAHELFMGMSATIVVDLGTRDAPAVPVGAVHTADSTGDAAVMVVLPEGRVELREVTLGQEVDGYIEVLSGLSAGENVVSNPSRGLVDGARVTTSG